MLTTTSFQNLKPQLPPLSSPLPKAAPVFLSPHRNLYAPSHDPLRDLFCAPRPTIQAALFADAVDARPVLTPANPEPVVVSPVTTAADWIRSAYSCGQLYELVLRSPLRDRLTALPPLQLLLDDEVQSWIARERLIEAILEGDNIRYFGAMFRESRPERDDLNLIHRRTTQSTCLLTFAHFLGGEATLDSVLIRIHELRETESLNFRRILIALVKQGFGQEILPRWNEIPSEILLDLTCFFLDHDVTLLAQTFKNLEKYDQDRFLFKIFFPADITTSAKVFSHLRPNWLPSDWISWFLDRYGLAEKLNSHNGKQGEIHPALIVGLFLNRYEYLRAEGGAYEPAVESNLISLLSGFDNGIAYSESVDKILETVLLCVETGIAPHVMQCLRDGYHWVEPEVNDNLKERLRPFFDWMAARPGPWIRDSDGKKIVYSGLIKTPKPKLTGLPSKVDLELMDLRVRLFRIFETFKSEFNAIPINVLTRAPKEIQPAIKAVKDLFESPDALRLALRDLIDETALIMHGSRNPKDQVALSQGQIRRSPLLAACLIRVKDTGIHRIASVRGGLTQEQAIQVSPFFDLGFSKEGSHGVDVHLIQLALIAPILRAELGEQALAKFLNFCAESPFHFKNLFDDLYSMNFSSPEAEVFRKVRRLLGLW